MNLTNLEIGVRLFLGFAVVFAFLIGVALTGWSSLSKFKQQTDVIVNERNVQMKVANDIRFNLTIVARAVRNHLIYSDKDMLSCQMTRIANTRKSFDETLEKSLQASRDEAHKKALSDIKA